MILIKCTCFVRYVYKIQYETSFVKMAKVLHGIDSAAAAAAAKSLQSCPTLCDPIDGSPPGSSAHGIFQARVLESSAIARAFKCLT